jgi:hypothetical protein
MCAKTVAVYEELLFPEILDATCRNEGFVRAWADEKPDRELGL